MAHHTHFLSRLERASDDEVNFAFSLYYDTDFTKNIVGRFCQESGNPERVAVALSSKKNPSHVILSGSGDFITCLGPNMNLGNVPVITQHKFGGLVKLNENAQERGAKLQAFAKTGISKADFLQNFSTRNLSREQFIIIETFYPLMAKSVLDCFSTLVTHSFNVSLRLQKMARRGKIRTRKDREILLDYWGTQWALGHNLLVMYADTTLANSAYKDIDLCFFEFGNNCTDSTCLAVIFMGLWFLSRMGYKDIPKIKRRFKTSDVPQDYLQAMLALFVLAMKRSSYKVEVTKLLKRKIPDFSRFPPADTIIVKSMQKGLIACLANPEKYLGYLKKYVASNFEKEFEHYTDSKPTREIPPNLQTLFLARNQKNFFVDEETIHDFVSFLPWLISIEAEEFFIPKEYNELFYPFKIEHAMQNIENVLFCDITSGLTRERKKTGRNSPCDCGSGKKYKACCLKKNKGKGQLLAPSCLRQSPHTPNDRYNFQ